MSDKPLVQQALASEIADILLSVTSVSVSLAFLRGFWESTVREWSSIDRLRYVRHYPSDVIFSPGYNDRIDKYYMLIRRFVNASFRLLIREEWASDACKEYNSILTDKGGPLWYALPGSLLVIT